MPTFPRTFICIDCKREFQYRNAMIMHRRFVHRDAASAPDKSAEAPVPAAKTLPTPTPGGRKTRQITRVTCPDCKMRLALNNLNRHRRARHDAVAVEVGRRNGRVPPSLTEEAEAWLAQGRQIRDRAEHAGRHAALRGGGGGARGQRVEAAAGGDRRAAPEVRPGSGA
jgi:hypothetical protein